MKVISQPAIFGIQNPKPLLNLPDGRARLRMRPNDFAQVFVKASGGLRCFHVTDKGDHWEGVHEFARNETMKNATDRTQ